MRYSSEHSKSTKRIERLLIGRMRPDDIHEICCLTQGEENNYLKAKLFELAKGEDEKVAYNALWAFSHFTLYDNIWLYGKHDELIDMAMAECHEGKKRLLLTLLLHQPFNMETLRTDFIDFCLAKIADTTEKYAVRAHCIKLAYEQCRFYPELLEELRLCLDMIASEPLSSGVRCARRNILKKFDT